MNSERKSERKYEFEIKKKKKKENAFWDHAFDRVGERGLFN